MVSAIPNVAMRRRVTMEATASKKADVILATSCVSIRKKDVRTSRWPMESATKPATSPSTAGTEGTAAWTTRTSPVSIRVIRKGGIVLEPSNFGRQGQMSALVHELGHSLGLWHVHRGVSEMECSHPCFETEPSTLLGDLCRDTKPTPENLYCQDPPVGAHSVCGKTVFTDTPYANYMGYSDDSCAREFTVEQVSRMHCYIDLVYDSVRTRDPTIALPPPLLFTAIFSDSSSVTLSWIPPLTLGAFYESEVCPSCSSTLQYSQYASRAESNEWGQPTTWDPSEAIGPPDAEPCVLGYNLWLPETSRCPWGGCVLTLRFDRVTVPSLLQIWVTWNARNGIREVEAVFEDDSSVSFDAPAAQCDSPLSLPFFTDRPLAKVRIRAAHDFVGIDSVRLVSTPNDLVCAACKPLRYRIVRNPPFVHGTATDTDFPLFTDGHVRPGANYTYRVQSRLGNKVTAYSPPLFFSTDNAVCGNSVLNREESCDDGNMINGDGCSSTCQIEDHYHCTGTPSLCYWHDSDGQCESFERKSSPSDCGFYTPNGFFDQWASKVQVGPSELTNGCFTDPLIGPPALPHNCGADQALNTSWTPCEFQLDTMYWITAYFAKPAVATSILLYLTSDGDGSQESSIATLHLLDEAGTVRHQVDVRFSCLNDPLELAIIRDLGLPFYETPAVNLTFSNARIQVAAIQMRSSKALNPIQIEECTAGELYHPELHKCEEYCKMPSCPELHAKHANVTCTGTKDGDSCSVFCDKGHYRPENSSPLLCTAGRWTGADPNCKPIDCGMPVIAHADIICQEATTYGKVCNYKCRPPARFIGGGNRLATTKCEADGKWSTPSSKCHLSCGLPVPPMHSVLASSRCRREDSFRFGQTCRFRCKSGYHVRQQNVRKRYVYLRCGIEGTWTGPDCVPVTCQAIEHLPHNCTAGNRFGSECSVQCLSQESFHNSHRCELDGGWSPPLPQCLACLSLPTVFNNEVGFSCQGQYVGAICKATCVAENKQLFLGNVSSERIRLNCTPSGEWLPNPEEVRCLEKCLQRFVGDGYCDASNNTPECAFDGGDCCPSTAPWRRVHYFPRDCEDPRCSCLDPQAEENFLPI